MGEIVLVLFSLLSPLPQKMLLLQVSEYSLFLRDGGLLTKEVTLVSVKIVVKKPIDGQREIFLDRSTPVYLNTQIGFLNNVMSCYNVII